MTLAFHPEDHTIHWDDMDDLRLIARMSGRATDDPHSNDYPEFTELGRKARHAVYECYRQGETQ